MKYEDIERRLCEISGETDAIRYGFETSNIGLRGKKGLPGPDRPPHDPKKECLAEIEIIIKDLQDIKKHITKND